MSAEFTSRLDDFRTRHAQAIDAALVAAAKVLETAVQRKHRGGYTSGAYSEGQVRKAITSGLPHTEDGERLIRVGIRGNGEPYVRGQQSPVSVGQISLFWELGHQNAWTRKYERVEKWRPAALESKDAVTTKFGGVYKAMMARGGT